MTTIGPLGPALPSRRARGTTPATTAFLLEEPAPDQECAAAVPAAPIGLHSLLALQEGPGASAQDRAARDHARQMLIALRDLQRAQLGTQANAGIVALERLARLADTIPLAGDPRLGAIVSAIAVRLAMELARREVMASDRRQLR